MKKMKKAFLLVSFVFLFLFFFFAHEHVKNVYADSGDETSTHLKDRALKNNQIYNDSFNQLENYYKVYQKWENGNIDDGDDRHVITAEDVTGGTLYEASQSYHYDNKTTYLEPGQKITFEINVDDAGLYQFYYDYYILQKTRLMPRVGIAVNGTSQYTEMNDLEVEVDWKLEEGKQFDRYDDELTPKSEITSNWNSQVGLQDPNHFFVEPLKFRLNKGTNEISLTVNEGYLLIGDITIETNEINIPTYQDYKDQIGDKPSVKELIKIEAEDITSKSKQSIRSKYMRDPKVTPYEYKNRVLNVLDGYSYGESGDRVSYTFDVEKSGYYQLALKYYLNTNNGLPSNRRILIDGKVPFKELESYNFEYQTKWTNEVLSDATGNAYEIYLEEGTHTLSLSVDNVEVRHIYHNILVILDQIEAISRDINKLTGGLVDKERNWKISNYIPDLEQKLQIISDDLDTVIDDLSDYTGNDEVPAIQELTIAKDLIDEFIEDPEEIPAYMNKFSQGDRSAHGRINTIAPTLIYNPLHLDKMYVYNNEELPQANAWFVVRLFEGIKAFFYSFSDPKYNKVAEVDEDTVEIWVNKSRLYVEIMQKMIDEEFTPETGVKVQLSLMPDENKIVLSNAAGSTPDGVIGISFGRPFELAIRGVTEDLSQYDGFYELAEEFNPNTFVPYIYDEGVYAIPMEQDVKLLYYRKDILGDLGETPPQTWEEVISLVPVLQKYDMDLYTPIGGVNAYKGLDATTPFIYQHGGMLYDQDTLTTVIDKDGAYEAFELMTDLFTVYNLPAQTANFYQHFRTGKVPVGIDGANMYIQLKYAAPELAGQWGVMPIPGVENEDGVIERWDPTYGSSSIIFKDSEKKEATWELIKWWSGKEAQTNFSYDIQSTLGDKFLYMSANVEAFKEGAWPTESKDEVLEQWEWIQTTGKVPGDYMVERELSNAWNKVVFDGINPRVAIDEAVSLIDRELQRKLLEFKYMDEDGNIIKPYKIPTIDNVEGWVRKDDEDTQ
ncbi:extracellular solute-binding protein [Haloplasma contractile]|uniref:Extracellular solute-binding protein family 1 n=1 Tax=Haloplasma contractile SSD-17B TaxID=1033810 RepID=U2EEE4_9MOLU|nr:extracellular solute-binding protein [Haloplasma contractile]ERJ13066.1 Extracellular solute-binding protein family 1 [Haloplasma contractile SSD-17B]